MNKWIQILVCAALLLAGCTGTESDEVNVDPESIKDTVSTEEYQHSAIWKYDHITGIPKRIRKTDDNSFTEESLIALYNSTQDSVKLQLQQKAADTIYVKILNSRYLTQRMGSSGADAFLSTATFTLTELPGIKYIHFNFQEGDHAVPGTYSREYYRNRWK